jgi:ketosteroid isomerase-like protein
MPGTDQFVDGRREACRRVSPIIHIIGGRLMKKISAFLLMTILAVGLSPARAEEKKADTASDLKALDAKLTEAFRTHESEALGKHMADDYMLIDPRGAVHTKKQYLEHLTKGTAKVKEFKETHVKVRSFGDTAFVTGVLEVKGKAEDKDVTAEYRWTRVYNKEGGEWLCVLEQHTIVVPKEEKK